MKRDVQIEDYSGRNMDEVAMKMIIKNSVDDLGSNPLTQVEVLSIDEPDELNDISER